MVPIGDVKPYERNPRHNDGAVDAVKASIQEFGFRGCILVDASMTIIAGHTRLKAAKALGMKEVPVEIADDLTEDQVKALRLVDNRTAELSGWDWTMLDQELDSIADVDMSEWFDIGGDAGIYGAGTDWTDGGGTLTDRFVVPPFSVLDTRQGYWRDRDAYWHGIIGDTGQARADATIFGSKLMPNNGGRSVLNPTLCEVICRWFGIPGGTCFDCFAGGAAFGIVSSMCGMHYTGIELRREQVDFNLARLRSIGSDAVYHCDDGRNVLDHIPEKSQDLLFSCPPYFNLERYSDDPRDASNQRTYADFLDLIDTAYANAIRCLKDDRFAVIVIGDVRDKDGLFFGMPSDIIDIFEANGARLYNHAILVNAVGSGAIRANGNMRSRKLVTVHQDVLVFYKGRTKAIRDNYAEIECEMDEEVVE